MPPAVARPIVLPWSCQRSGDCCRLPSHVTTTRAEYAAMMTHPASFGRRLVWTVDPTDADRLRLTAGPCPFLDGTNRCAVYDVRPMNCRRFGCFRPDVRTEPLELDRSVLGCANLSDRFRASRAIRRAYRALEQKAHAWGAAHGWTA